jgi:predicted transcriptional regulator
MEVIHRLRRAGVAEVRKQLPDPPSYSAVRATLRILEEKGVVRHTKQGRRYVFRATTSRARVRERALQRLLKTFFDGSAEQAVAALLDRANPSEEELARIAKRIEAAKRKGQ